MAFSVTSNVDKDQYLELNRVARENRSTIGAIVRLAIRMVIPKLKDPKILKQLEPDLRAHNGRKERKA